MSALLRNVFWLAVSAGLSWWFVFGLEPAPAFAGPAPEPPRVGGALQVTTVPAPSAPAPESPVEEEEQVAAVPEAVPVPVPAPELPEPEPVAAPDVGTPDAEEDAVAAEALPEPEPASEAQDELPAAPPAPGARELMARPDLVRAAREELSGETPRGFSTTLLAAPEEQLDIARFFGEELVLLPRAALDPEASAPRWFRVATGGAPRIETVEGPPPRRFRQYRDLFAYEYQRLPEPLRDLRRSVLARDEVFLFAALIPASEWALVIARRRAALEDAGREAADLRGCALRYTRRGEGYDLLVDELQFTDGSRHRPSPEPSDFRAE